MKPWRWFDIRVAGLFTIERSRLGAYFRHVEAKPRQETLP